MPVSQPCCTFGCIQVCALDALSLHVLSVDSVNCVVAESIRLLSYTPSAVLLQKGSAITPLVPFTNSPASAFDAVPPLPSGLVLNTVTGQISGM